MFSDGTLQLLDTQKEETPSLEVVDGLAGVLLGTNKWSDELCSRLLAEAVWAVLLESTRCDVPADRLVQQLSALANPTLADRIAEVYQKRVDAVRDMLSSSSWKEPEVVGSTWTVGKATQCSLGGSGEVPDLHCSLQLETTEPGRCDAKKHSLTLNLHQLIDLQWKVREAQNSMDKAVKK